MNHKVNLQELSGLELLQYHREIGKLFEKLSGEQFEPDLLERLCECAVLGFYSLKDENGAAAYSSPEEVLRTIPFRELVKIPEEYELCFPEDDTTE